MTETDRDWRKSAYLRKENWPEAIPWTGPRRAYGPYSWGKADIDGCKYPSNHPDAASIGHNYIGDVCPWCGVPLHGTDEEVVLHNGSEGTLIELTELGDPEPAFHPGCYTKWRGRDNAQLTEWLE
jgi:hypothetical protein